MLSAGYEVMMDTAFVRIVIFLDIPVPPLINGGTCAHLQIIVFAEKAAYFFCQALHPFELFWMTRVIVA
ncbi:MAG: hypothetical protein A3J09_02725 [Candidatus Zambryskibacteria bacterium RIFCSPLOWO2_02_FULL_51_21]|uniref:Uncharacterized protein n=1 Tax=Candidatus Zambryskibacteria bacterium RIFCSPHIGHO2_02_FULL_43_37 TaxID=1802749 RepID=A0A1G2TG85_9BACT|nr:MAG: hypothetical protein A2723_02715 [Candidatus Zambryskibacteria bacterium RIFCSPHIGHO2_01_FULL_52_18]OHA96305.1 MAG: hypothetical protein A3D49_00175 [Candidatus Zambryskibacteria bacterium RIFCSPHIGHO2_02_FULL_43_37]OHB07708.1 MAG: hypothetical protein A2944_00050 [Candidatus Zambryskibacteria bacterium RIFCSPLOWO2_01_FULL_52_12]OHB11436.1 MAG: hypothetical protein A3J09_02725 [Candidatus Zambryskibacteria bacterium RIFCSPLOWO2_02_FULL_51_21]